MLGVVGVTAAPLMRRTEPMTPGTKHDVVQSGARKQLQAKLTSQDPAAGPESMASTNVSWPSEEAQCTAKGCWPRLFILGTQKAATSSLFQALVDNGSGCGAVKTADTLDIRTPKETHFFRPDGGNTWEKLQWMPEAYTKLYQPSDCPQRYFIDATAAYLRSASAPAHFQQVMPSPWIPELRFVAVLREPIARDLAWYNHQLADNWVSHASKQKNFCTASDGGRSPSYQKEKFCRMKQLQFCLAGESKNVGFRVLDEDEEAEFSTWSRAEEAKVAHAQAQEMKEAAPAPNFEDQSTWCLGTFAGDDCDDPDDPKGEKREKRRLQKNEKKDGYDAEAIIAGKVTSADYLGAAYDKCVGLTSAGGQQEVRELGWGFYEPQLQAWTKVVKRSQLLVLNFDQLVEAPHEALPRVATFFGVPELGSTVLPQSEANTSPPVKVSMMTCVTRARLEALYSPWNNLLLTSLLKDHDAGRVPPEEPRFEGFQSQVECTNEGEEVSVLNAENEYEVGSLESENDSPGRISEVILLRQRKQRQTRAAKKRLNGKKPM